MNNEFSRVSKFNYSTNLFFSLIKRHLKVLFTNPIRVFYTLMTPIVILLVYILFLRELELSTVKNTLYSNNIDPNIPGLMLLLSTVADSWMLSGVIALSSITISLQICSIIVEDKVNGVSRDFVASPINKTILFLSYFFYLFIVTFALCFIVLLVNFIVIGSFGEFYITFTDFLLMVAIVLFTTILACLTSLVVASLVKSEPVLASISAIVSTAAGFLIGAYMPLSMLPVSIQYFCAFIPWTYSCALNRFAFLSTPLNNLSAFLHDPSKIVLPEGKADELMGILNKNFSYRINFFEYAIEPGINTLISIGWIIIFIFINILITHRLLELENKIKKRKHKKLNK